MPELSVKTIKSLMFKELYAHYKDACQNTYSSTWRAFIHRGYHDVIVPRIESATTFDELEEILSLMDYKMSLQDWIDSL